MQSRYLHPRIFNSIILIALAFSACDDFVDIDPPRTALVQETVFESDATATAAVLDIYHQLRTGAFASGSLYSVSYLGTLLSDEQQDYYVGTPESMVQYQQFNSNQLEEDNGIIFTLWADLYKTIYKCNAVMGGLAASNGMSPATKLQLEGEARFIRAFCYFYLVNLWGDVPLLLSTDYRVNSKAGRTNIDDVYTRILDDLAIAKNQLPETFSSFSNTRVRATKWAAIALLARTYVYREAWANAEAEATALISNTELFSLPELSTVFSANSNEAILQWWSNQRTLERGTFRFFDVPVLGAIREEFAESFESEDMRRSTWIQASQANYLYAAKYTANTAAQFSTPLRLAELYLIRAEARAQQENFAGAREDLNAIRSRAGLAQLDTDEKEELLLAVELERRSELFTEWGHRWLDLKRTHRAMNVLGVLKPSLTIERLLLPLPESELRTNAGLKDSQNPGY
jgi:starch-binding outer membrane protein, SusD/RagB family